MASFRKEVLPALQEKTRQLMEEKNLPLILKALCRDCWTKKRLKSKRFPGDGAFWAEIDFMEDYERAVAQYAGEPDNYI